MKLSSGIKFILSDATIDLYAQIISYNNAILICGPRLVQNIDMFIVQSMSDIFDNLT